MKPARLTPIIAGFLLSACAAVAPSLNSERIAATFGNFGIDVLSQSDGVRRSNLYSTHGEEKITRTYAIVLFEPELPNSVSTLHADVLDGASIGATFKAAGWTIEKTTIYIGSVALESDPYAIATMMQLEGQPELALHAYQFALRKGAQHIDYATIIEAHHPDYLDYDELAAIYPVVRHADSHRVATLKSLLLHPDVTNALH